MWKTMSRLMSKITGGTPKADPPKVDAEMVKSIKAATAKAEQAGKKTKKKAKASKAKLSKLTKAQLVTWGKENLDIEINKSHTKAALIKQFLGAK